MENENPQKRRLFAPRADRPDLEPEDTTPNFSYFFKQLWRKAGKLISLNLLMIFQMIPLVVIVVVYMMGPKIPTVESSLYAPLLGIQTAGNSPIAGSLLGLFGRQLEIPVMTTGRLVVILIMAGFLLLTWGWQNVGSTYNIRSLVRGDSCFLWSDYFYAIKRNFKQGFLFGILDLLIIAVLSYNTYFYLIMSADTFYGIISVVNIALSVIYICMRAHIYPMMITFDLSIFKLMKNGLIFTLLGACIKRNICMLLGLAVSVALTLFIVIGGLSIGLSFTLILPFFYFLPLTGFIMTYCAYPNIKRHMIDPYEQPAEIQEN